jgi:hypothetical protein
MYGKIAFSIYFQYWFEILHMNLLVEFIIKTSAFPYLPSGHHLMRSVRPGHSDSYVGRRVSSWQAHPSREVDGKIWARNETSSARKTM